MKRVLFSPRNIAATAGGSGKRGMFDPDGSEYDYTTAKARGMKPDGEGHWSSRDPETGMLLKGSTHPTFKKGVAADEALGYELVKRNGRYYTLKGGRP